MEGGAQSRLRQSFLQPVLDTRPYVLFLNLKANQDKVGNPKNFFKFFYKK
jgi:hypothetical protein